MRKGSIVVAMCWILLSGCGVLLGSGKVETRALPHAGFQEVLVEAGFQVELRQAPSYEVKASIDDNIWKDVQITQRAELLSFSLPLGTSVQRATMIARVQMPSLTKIDLPGRGAALLRGFKSKLPITIQLDGSGSCSGELDAPEVNVNVAGDGSVRLQGQGSRLYVDLSGSGSVDMSQLRVNNAHIDLSGSGHIKVHATGTVSGTIDGSGTLTVIGTRDIQVTIAGSGQVLRK